MKLKRLVATMLTLLLMVSLLPIGAMADGLPNYEKDQGNINGQIGTNIAIAVEISKSGSVQKNTGSVAENEGTVVNNNGTVVINKAGGTVETNKAGGNVQINQEGGTIKTNNGTVGFQKSDGSVEPTYGNYGTINNNENGGRVLINQNTGVVDLNKKGGTIETNKGIVGSQNEFGSVAPTSGNYGTINNNESGGKVLINQAGGTIETNYGLVGRKNDEGFAVIDDDTGNFGTITTNYGNITQNKNLVVTNAKIDTNTNGNIYINDGTVKNNESIVCDNNGTVETNENWVQNNKINGTVGTNNKRVQYNFGTVGTNNDLVEENYGTVTTNNIDGTVHNYNRGEGVPMRLDDEGAASSENKPVVVGVGTNFGSVTNYVGNSSKIYYGLSWGDSVNSLNEIESFLESGTTLNLNDYAAKASRSGYKMTGYTAFARKDGEDSQITETANYTMNAPVWLQILWEKLGKSAQPTRTPVYTKLSAEQVKVGTFVRCGNMTFKIIEVTDDSIRVATVGKLSDTALADMLGFLKQHLSDAQIAKLIGEPALLEQELVSKFFGGSDEHIAFYASADLFA